LGMELRGGSMISRLGFFPMVAIEFGYNHVRFRYIAPLSMAGYVISPFLTGDLSRMGVEEVPLVD
jgi:hypothetical protein